MDFREREEFILLTKVALLEEDPDRFVEILLKRDPYIGRLLKENPNVFGNDMDDCLPCETQVLERLEIERSKVIEKMDSLSKNRKAVRTYSSKFPFPPTLSFFNKTG